MIKRIIDYSGLKVFIGIDVHLRQYTIACRCDGQIVKRCQMVADPEALARFILRHFRGAEVQTAYEAGFSGFRLHRVLESHGIKNLVVHAASIEVSKKKVKTDKRDSLKIAEQLEAGRLKGIRIPSEAEEVERALTRTREQIVRMRTRVLNQIRMRFHQFGLLSHDEERRMGPRLAKEVLGKIKEPKLVRTIESMLAVRSALSDEVKKHDQWLEEQAAADPWEATYRKVPGIGPLAARILSNELGTMSQFPNEKALFSFTGLTPSEDTSDQSRHLGHITRQGSSRLRHVLVETAWMAIRKDPVLKGAFERIAAKAGKKRAIVAIARKLIGRARALFRKKEDYKRELDLAA